MDADGLRELQRPLKQKYREDAEAACVPVNATGTAGGDTVSCTVETGLGPLAAGLHPATGGDGTEACSGDLLLQALVACAGVTLRAVATALSVEMRGARIRAEGTFDARGTLGVSKEAPVGVTDVVLMVDVETDADDATLEKLAVLTERYCVVAQSLYEPPRLLVRRAAAAV